MDDISEKYLEEFISSAHQVAQRRLVFCGSGNLSWRVDDGTMLITATRAWLGDLSKDQVARCRIEDGASVNGKTPSVEVGFHRAIMRRRPDVNIVLHFQSAYATALACCESPEQNFFVTPEIPYYIGPVAFVPYMDPGSDELVHAVTSAMLEHNLVVLRNHGQVTAGKDFRETLQRAVFFELASQICLLAGDNLDHLSQRAVDALYKAREQNRQSLHGI